MRFEVRVPATSANLGPGFDSFGLALDLCNEVVVDTGADTAIAWEGEGAAELPTDGSDLVSRTIATIADRMRLEPPSLAVRGRNRIPLGRGLGSSSAAIVAGVVIASRALDLGLEGGDASSVFALAAELEGHPDNVAAATFGGFTVALPDGTVRRFEPHPDLRPVVIVPPFALPTDEARAALPDPVPRADAVYNAAHAALVVEAVTRDPSLLRIALRDRLHQEARLALAPDAAEVFDDIARRHVPVCVSGAGPSLLAFPPDGAALDHETLELPTTWRILTPGTRSRGFDASER
ncbi:MAG TPA: homoserine kinase [Actinomycetota bacterium]|nr:homoserine kinase [Actinomycetota bacterium]